MEQAGLATPTLHRALSPVGVMMLVFSALSPVMSVYIGGAGVLHMAGTGAAIAFILGGVIAAVLALLYAELAAAFPRAGGTYPTIAAVLGHGGAFPLTAVNMIVQPATLAFTALGFADYARVLAPGLPLVPVAVAALALASAIAALNVRTGAWVTGLFLVVEGVALVLLAGVALAHPARLLQQVLTHPVMLDHGALTPVHLATLALATVSGAWTCAGASYALYFGEEMHDAPRRIGRVVAWCGLIAALSIAVPTILMVLSIQDLPRVLGAEAPVATFLSQTGGPRVATVVSIGVVVAIFNCLIATSIAISRLFYATGRDGLWPVRLNAALSHLHPRLRSPVFATTLLGVISALLLFLGERSLLVLISGDVAAYLLISLAVLVGRRRRLTGARFSAPFHPVIPVFGLIVTGVFIYADWADVAAGRPSVILLGGVFLASLAYFHFYLRRASQAWLVAEILEVEVDVEIIAVT